MGNKVLDNVTLYLTNALVMWQQSKKNKQIVHMPQLSAVCGKFQGNWSAKWLFF